MLLYAGPLPGPGDGGRTINPGGLPELEAFFEERDDDKEKPYKQGTPTLTRRLRPSEVVLLMGYIMAPRRKALMYIACLNPV